MRTASVPRQLSDFIESISRELSEKEKLAHEAEWTLAVEGGEKAARAHESAKIQFYILKSDSPRFQTIKYWKESGNITDPTYCRILDVLYRTLLPYQISARLLENIAKKEAELKRIFQEFRGEFNGQKLSYNEIAYLLREEKNPAVCQEIWEASKQIGKTAGPYIVELTKFRNEGARELCFSNYYEMKLAMDEINHAWLTKFFRNALKNSTRSFHGVRAEIDNKLSQKYGVLVSGLGPWAWGVFTQEDPIVPDGVDRLFQGRDVMEFAREYFRSVGFIKEVEEISSRSDFYEREGKDQFGFCMPIDRNGDVRVLLNISPDERCVRTTFHEFGHGVDIKNINLDLPWVLRTYCHKMTTEALAFFLGEAIYDNSYLIKTLGDEKNYVSEFIKSRKRQRLIFSRWVALMTMFESKLYEDPGQDLNSLWWRLTEDFQGIPEPKRPKDAMDWASKVHIALYPAYYHNYLLADIIKEQLMITIQRSLIGGIQDPFLAEFLRGRWCRLGASLRWDELVRFATGESLNSKYWVKSFNT